MKPVSDSMSPESPFPMAPAQAVWDAWSAAERRRFIETLPVGITEAELSPPEGDPHLIPKLTARDSLIRYFDRLKRKVYVGCELPVYYPAEPRFAPDLFVVFDAEPGERDFWVVSAEGRGLDWVMEVHRGGDRKKDEVKNRERYARLKIPEYFLFDAKRRRLSGFRLPEGGAGPYVPIVPQLGAFPSHALGLDLAVEGGKVRIFVGGARLPDSDELIERLTAGIERLEARAQESEVRLDEEERQRQEALERIDALVERAELARAEAAEQRTRAEAEQARAESARAEADELRKRAEAEQARAESLASRLAEVEAALEALRRGQPPG